MTTQKSPRRPVDDIMRVPAARSAPPAISDYDWPASPALELWALRTRLEAVCRKGEARQGWVPCRVVRRLIGAA